MSAVPKPSFTAILNDAQARHDRRVHADRRMARALGRFQALATAAVAQTSRAEGRRGDSAGPVSQVQRAYAYAEPADAEAFTLAELIEQLGDATSVEALRALRRTFAATRHPDRVALAERRRATHEMQTANDLIDRAIAQRAAAVGT